MKEKNNEKKLSFQRETIANLTLFEMNHLKGGTGIICRVIKNLLADPPLLNESADQCGFISGVAKTYCQVSNYNC
jgi:hypothetical protein